MATRDIVFTEFFVYFGEEISDFRLRSGRFLPQKFKLILRMFELISQRKENTFFIRPIAIRRGVTGIALESEGNKKVIDKSAIINKRGDINKSAELQGA